MAINAYHIDQLVRVTATCTVAGVATDPTTLTLRVKDPTGATTTYTLVSSPALVKDSTGVYHYDLAASIAGTWSYHWEGTGVQGSDDQQFFVEGALA